MASSEQRSVRGRLTEPTSWLLHKPWKAITLGTEPDIDSPASLGCAGISILLSSVALATKERVRLFPFAFNLLPVDRPIDEITVVVVGCPPVFEGCTFREPTVIAFDQDGVLQEREPPEMKDLYLGEALLDSGFSRLGEYFQHLT